MNIRSLNTICFVLSIIIVCSLVFLNLGNGFFWDTVQLASQHASYYFTTDFSKLLLPNDLDSGHIPIFGMYVAMFWKFLGRTVEVSHISMLTFAICIVWQIRNICNNFIPIKYSGFALVLILLDPSLMSQITLVSPDVPLVFFFFLALNSVLKNKKTWLAIGIFLLFMISMRGMMVAFCILCLDIYLNIGFTNKTALESIKSLIKRSLLYLPSLALFIAFNTYHYHQKGWIGYHEDSPWANCFEPVDFSGFLFNVGLLGWRILDFGRIGIWIVFIILVLRYKAQILSNPKTRLLLVFFITILIFLPLNMLWAKNLVGYRYLMPIYLIFSLLTAGILFSSYVGNKLRLVLTVFWLLVLLSGNFWIYPPKIAKGWDSTLAHLPYYKLRTQAIQYLDIHKIDYKEVDSFFPNNTSFDEIDLNNDTRAFDTFEGNSSPYVFYSNIFNIEDELYDKIIKEYKPIQYFENSGVYIVIYKNRNLQ
jgi:hypothetical protein